jgi:hypothetical protein
MANTKKRAVYTTVNGVMVALEDAINYDKK